MSLATKPALSASGTDPAWRTCKRRQTRSTKQDRMMHLWLLIQFFERWLVPCCWALPPLATNLCIVASLAHATLRFLRLEVSFGIAGITPCDAGRPRIV